MWGKMRLRGGGDKLRTSFAFRKTRHLKQRDNTCIRVRTFLLLVPFTHILEFQYEITYDDAQDTATVIYYGVLEKILVCELDEDPLWKHLRRKTLLLALVTPFKTNGVNAALKTTFYRPSESLASIVTDLRNIVSCIGRVQTCRKWGIIDRDIRLVQPSFAEGEIDESDGSDMED